MSHNVLVAAAALGGSIQSFEQLNLVGMKGNCMIHAARWLRAKWKQGDYIKKYGNHSIGHRKFTLPEETPIALDRGYSQPVAGSYNGNIYLEFERRQPDEAYERKANEVRTAIKPTPTALYQDKLDLFVGGGRKGLERKATQLTFRRNGDPANIPIAGDWQDQLLVHFSKPGYYLAALVGGTPHEVAFFVTDVEFWYFDPAIGELKLGRDSVGAWLQHADVQKYLSSDGRSFISVSSYTEAA